MRPRRHCRGRASQGKRAVCPRGGLILAKEEYAKKLNSAVFPGTQGGPLEHIIAAKAICFKEAMAPEFKTYAQNIVSNAKVMAEALLAEGLIDGEDSDYGLYITTVNGITLDWEKDGKYWAFYINGEYAMTGVDATNAEDGAVYTFKPE